MNSFTQAVQNFLSKNPVETIKEFHLIDVDWNDVVAPGTWGNWERRIAFCQSKYPGTFIFDKLIHL